MKNLERQIHSIPDVIPMGKVKILFRRIFNLYYEFALEFNDDELSSLLVNGKLPSRLSDLVDEIKKCRREFIPKTDLIGMIAALEKSKYMADDEKMRGILLSEKVDTLDISQRMRKDEGLNSFSFILLFINYLASTFIINGFKKEGLQKQILDNHKYLQRIIKRTAKIKLFLDAEKSLHHTLTQFGFITKGGIKVKSEDSYSAVREVLENLSDNQKRELLKPRDHPSLIDPYNTRRNVRTGTRKY